MLSGQTRTPNVPVWLHFLSPNNNCACKHCAHAGKGLHFIEESFGVWVRVVISRLGRDLERHCDIFRKNYLGT